MKKIIFILTALLLAGIFIPERSHASVVVPGNAPVILPGNPDPATVKSAIRDFKNLSKKEKKERIKEVKTLIRHYKAEKKAGHPTGDKTFLDCIICILSPPFALLPSFFRHWLYICTRARSTIDSGSVYC